MAVMGKDTEIKLCPYCKAEIRPLDSHAVSIKADSPTDKSFILVACHLVRYYNVEPKDVNG